MSFLEVWFSFSSDLERVWLLFLHILSLHPFSPLSHFQPSKYTPARLQGVCAQAPEEVLSFHLIVSGLHVELLPFLSSRSLIFPSVVS